MSTWSILDCQNNLRYACTSHKHWRLHVAFNPFHSRVLVIFCNGAVRLYILAFSLNRSQTNEFIRQNIGIWCQEWPCDKSIRMIHRSLCMCICMCVRTHEHVQFEYVQMCHSTCLWAVTMLIGVTVIFDCSPSRWALNLTGSKNKCRKSHLWDGSGWEACGPTQLHNSHKLPWYIPQHHTSYSLPAAEPSKLPFQF